METKIENGGLYMRREELVKEGLFITEFSNEFFKTELEKYPNLKKDIQEKSDYIVKLQKNSNEGIWHCIFQELIKKIAPHGIIEFPEKNRMHIRYPDIEELVKKFYEERLFFTMDTAQKIIYNLNRLGNRSVYDMEDSEEIDSWEEDGLTELLDIGRKQYGTQKDITVDLIPDLERLESKYQNCNYAEDLSVHLPKKINDKKIELETDFLKLNVLYLGNEKLRDYLYHFKVDLDCLEMLEKQIKKLEESYNETGVSLQYIWEKMTSFNTINLFAKFFLRLIEQVGGLEKQKSEILQCIVKRNFYLFRQINKMPNVLTKLLLIKFIFNYIENKMRKIPNEERYQFVLDALEDMNVCLINMNKQYEMMQEGLVSLATMIRWNIQKKVTFTSEWIKELETEFPVSLFEKWMISLNIEDLLVNPKVINENIEKELRDESCVCISKEYSINQESNSNIKLKWKKDLKKDLLEIIGEYKYINEASRLAEELKKDGWVSHISIIKNMDAEVTEEDYMLTPLGMICVATSDLFSQKSNSKKEACIDEELPEIIKNWLLSENKHVIFENTYSHDEKTYRKIFNLLLYHFYA